MSLNRIQLLLIFKKFSNQCQLKKESIIISSVPGANAHAASPPHSVEIYYGFFNSNIFKVELRRRVGSASARGWVGIIRGSS